MYVRMNILRVNLFKNWFFKYLIVILVFATLFVFSLNNDQCCDTIWYVLDRESLKLEGRLYYDTGFPDAHNYMYPFFLLVIDFIGLNTRLEIGLVQVIVQLISIHYSAKMISKYILLSFTRTFLLISLIFIYPVYAYSSYTLTESLTASAYLVFCSSFLSIIKIDSIKTHSFRNLFFLLTLTSSILWMLRPSFFWIIFASFFLIAYKVFSDGSFHPFLISKYKFFANFIILTILIISPQFFVSSTETSLIGKYLKLNLIRDGQFFERSVYRYFTNLSDCGPVSFLFSPYAETVEGIYGHSERVPILSLDGLISRFASGWDYYPQVTPYITNLDQTYFKFFVFISGLMLSGPFLIAKGLKASHQFKQYPLFFGLLSLALVSQAQITLTHGELRYNIVGYITFGMFFVLFKVKKRDLLYWIISSIAIGLFLFWINSRIYALNDTFIQCVG
jgi:hypothetical protein